MVGAPWLDPDKTGGARRLDPRVKAALRATSRALEGKLSAETLRQDAEASLLAGETDRALVQFSKAAELDPDNAVVWNDISVTHLRQSAVDSHEMVLALAAANRAVRLAPTLPAARFNRALALQRLSLQAESAAEWKRFLSSEQDPLWRREAQNYAAALRRPTGAPSWQDDLQAFRKAATEGRKAAMLGIVARSSQLFREHLEEELLGQWALAEDEHRRREANDHLTLARMIAAALHESGGDSLATGVIAHIDRARRDQPRCLHVLARGFLAYREGVELAKQSRFSSALVRFQVAKRLLASQGNPFSGWATVQIAYCQYQLLLYRPARAELKALTQDPVPARDKALRGRALWILGLIDGIEGNLTGSLTAHTAAESEFRSIGEKANANRLNSMLAYGLDLLGQRNEAWRRLYPSLLDSSSIDSPRVRFTLCEIASWLAQEEGQIDIALLFQEEVVRSAQILGKPLALVGALYHHAALLTVLGRNDEAIEDLSQAKKQLELLPDLPTRRSSEGDLRLVEGKLALTDSPRQAIHSLDVAIEIFRSTSYHFQLGQAFYLRSLAELSLGRNDDAEHDLLAAITESESQRKKISSTEDRISYFDRTRELLDTMISFQLDRRHDPKAALHFSEKAKARVLLDWILTQPTGGPDPQNFDQTSQIPLDTKPLQEDLPAGTAVIEYAVLPQSTAIWVLRRGVEPKVVTVKGGAAVLGDLVQKLHRAVLEDQALSVQTTAEKLYSALIAPFAPDLLPGERLVFVPDGTLHALPFTLLRDPKTRRYLVQDHVCSVAPSIRVLKASLRRAGKLKSGQQRALMIADPAPDRGLYPALTRLDSSETAASIAQLFPGLVLRAEDATRGAFLRSAGGFEIVHFGGHSVVNTEYPLLSQMVLAPAPGDSNRGVLYSGDILRQHFPKTRLVVLASCATAAGKISRTEGVENLARPFLAAGVPVVVASLWDVGDKVTGDFFARFYRNLKKGWDVAGALQAAQVEVIEQDPAAKPRAWAAFEVIGGSIPESR